MLASIPSSVLSAQALRVGPGRPFADVGAAVAAARSGQLILVDPGTYPAFAIAGKGVAVYAAQGSFSVGNGTGTAVDISGVSAGETVTVFGCVTSVVATGPSVVVRDCAGTVRLQSVFVTAGVDLPNAAMRGAIEIVRSPSVWLADVEVLPPSGRKASAAVPVPVGSGMDAGIAAVVAEDSTVLLQRCQMRGFDNPDVPAGGAWAGDALRLIERSAVVLWGDGAPGTSLLAGGDGGFAGGSCVQFLAAQPVPDIYACGQIAYRTGAGANRGGKLSINHDLGLVQLTPYLVVRDIPLCIWESVGLVTAPPTLSLNTATTFQVTSLPRLFAVYVGPSRVATKSVTGVVNPAILDYGSPWTVPVHVGVLPQSGSASVQILVPQDGALVGLQLGCQAVFGPLQGPSWPFFSLSMGQLLTVVP